MASYLVNFSIYTLAMVGIIFAALFVFKSVMNGKGFSKKTSFLQVEDTMNLSARKTLYVVRAGGQKFLLAGDIDRTSLIAKLDSEEPDAAPKAIREDKSFELNSLDGIESLEEFSSIINFQKNKEEKTERYKNGAKAPMMRELARKLSSL